MISADRQGAPGRAFRPGLLPTLLTLFALAVLLALGTWQVQRMFWKHDLIAMREAQLTAEPVVLPGRIEDPAAWAFRRVEVEGTLLPDHTQYFGAEAHHGRFGHHLLVPLERADGSVVLVDHGWVPADWRPQGRSLEPDMVRIEGIARDRSEARAGPFTPDNEPDNRLWFWYDLEALRTATGLELLPVVVEAARGDGQGPPIGGRTVIDLPNDHLGYAITWYGLAIGAVLIYLLYGFRAGRSRP